jgi:nitrite reductase/ring-hydroxylating ferredoxin subunit
MSNQNGFVPVLDENELQEGTMKLVSVEGSPVLLIKQSGQIFAIDTVVLIWVALFQVVPLRV